MSNYPPGVSGNEPEITGEWPCLACQGARGEEDAYADEWGDVCRSFDACPRCKGTGIEPEEFDVDYLEALAKDGPATLFPDTVETLRGYDLDRNEPVERRILRSTAKMHRESRPARRLAVDKPTTDPLQS